MKKGEAVENFNLTWNKQTFLFLLIGQSKLREMNFLKKEEPTEGKWLNSTQLLMKLFWKRIKVWLTNTQIEKYMTITKLRCWMRIIVRFTTLISNHRKIHMLQANRAYTKKWIQKTQLILKSKDTSSFKTKRLLIPINTRIMTLINLSLKWQATKTSSTFRK